jgi:phage terminase small subunit
MPKTKDMTPKQQKFVAEYARNGGNASAAAKVAYPDQSEKAAGEMKRLG